MDKNKAIGMFRLNIGYILAPLRIYGQDPFVNEAAEEIIKAALVLHQRLSGDEPIYQPPKNYID